MPLLVDLVVAGHVPDDHATYRAQLASRPELITRLPFEQFTCRAGHV
jgi:hypothetical protein